MISFRISRHRRISIVLLFVYLVQFLPTASFALTSGPSQPELQSFQPVGATEMVDLFSGDFNYNIPLFELPGPNGGYPFNLSYQAGIVMDQESSWVGLGWNLNPGAINRQMRGLPDEFKGDPIYTKMSINPSVTVGLGAGVTAEILGKDIAASKFGFTVTQNNYKGIGYSIDPTLGFGKTTGSGMFGQLGVSLNAKDGIGIEPNLGLSGKIGSIGLGADYNSKAGLYNLSIHPAVNLPRSENSTNKNERGPASITATLSLAHPSYTPQVSMPMKNLSLSATVKLGAGWEGLFPDAYVNGFYNEQWLKNNKKIVKTSAYGYLNYQYATDRAALTDFNREKDGMVSKESPNLAMPALTYDIYSVNGQGLSAMYRPFRNDYGIVHDPEVISDGVSVAAGVDVGPLFHWGGNLALNYSKSVSGMWTDNNRLASQLSFQQGVANDLYEPWYFKSHGEPSANNRSTLDALGGTDAVRISLTGGDFDPEASTNLERTGWQAPMPSNKTTNRDRKSRNQSIQSFTNQQILGGDGEMIPLFNIDYLDESGNETKYNRANLPGHHIAGFTALNPEGLQYNYGIPAYNLLQEDVAFSTQKSPDQVSLVNVGNTGGTDPQYEYDNTDKYLKKTQLPPYAHSYLLTSIVGPDYVDVGGDGVTEDDLGYWVKFTYQRTAGTTNPYRWRSPFSKAHYIEGWKTDPRDDKGNFSYGEKELWYLAKAETRSHIAVFSITDREDARGAAMKLQDDNNTGVAVAALNSVTLYARQSPTPIKTVKFEYDYSLCQGVDNSVSYSGKLTLKKVWFEYGASQKGSLNPYVFTYSDFNPSYDIHAYDRWGNYKPYPYGEYLSNTDFPYVDQDPAHKEQTDLNVQAWTLKEIMLPSGGKIAVDYESDDYAYVQQQQAMQMTGLVDPYQDPTHLSETSTYSLVDNNLKIRFNLEAPINGSQSVDQRAEVLKYLDQKRKQLYFKLKLNLRSPGENFQEYICGYADIDFTRAMGLEKDASGAYQFGYFYVVPEQGHHPFSMRAWQHIRTNQPDLANSGRKLKQTNSNSERVSQIKSLASIGAQVRQMFEGYYNYCSDKNWGREVQVDKSWIRLNSPDKLKYGGGLRVKQVTINDQWADNEEGIYGQTYDYTTLEGGKSISSGVATFEPIVGGDENSLRYSKKYTQSVPLRSDNNLFFEYPINESYFPGPQVGYSKVTVTSLAAASMAGKSLNHVTLSDGNSMFPTGTGVSYGTTGMSVHEFYTARDFPVMTSETDKANKPYKLTAPIPVIGNLSISKLTTSQGYSIVTNDMHGKIKKVSNYRQDSQGHMEATPIAWVKYNYMSKPAIYDSEEIFRLSNTFTDKGDGTLVKPSSADLSNVSIPKYSLGEETEFVIDMRQFDDEIVGGGANGNMDVLVIPFFFPIIIGKISVLLNGSSSTSLLRTSVTNKIIFQSGILESTEAFDGGSLVKTSNLSWDKTIGTPVLTRVNSDYDAPVFSLQVPAHSKYMGMGAAYQNIGLVFDMTALTPVPGKSNYYSFSSLAGNKLYPGDEILIYPHGTSAHPNAKAVFTGVQGNRFVVYSESGLNARSFTAMIVRSGYRNQLTVQAGSITSLTDPTTSSSQRTYSKSITVPK